MGKETWFVTYKEFVSYALVEESLADVVAPSSWYSYNDIGCWSRYKHNHDILSLYGQQWTILTSLHIRASILYHTSLISIVIYVNTCFTNTSWQLSWCHDLSYLCLVFIYLLLHQLAIFNMVFVTSGPICWWILAITYALHLSCVFICAWKRCTSSSTIGCFIATMFQDAG